MLVPVPTCRQARPVGKANIGNSGTVMALAGETSAAAAKIWQEARPLGYDAYGDKLIWEGKYR